MGNQKNVVQGRTGATVTDRGSAAAGTVLKELTKKELISKTEVKSISVPAKNANDYDGNVVVPHALHGMDIKTPLFICAEPGMGKTYVASWIMRHAKRDGWNVNQFSLQDFEREKAARRVTRICRDMIKRIEDGKQVLLVIDGIVPGDECDCACEARAIMRLIDRGGRVVVCLRPEAEQLSEAIPDSVCLHADELLFRYLHESDGDYELTGGIPGLVASLKRDGDSRSATKLGTHYLNALDDLLGKTIRPELPLEDQCLRFAAILLGSGTMEELAQVSGRCDAEQFVWLDRDVPLIDADIASRRFSVHGVSSTYVISMCLDTLQRHAANYPAVVSRACAVLAKRGSVRRSATICALCSSEYDFAATGTTWGVPYIEAGEVTLVREALKTAKVLEQPLDVPGQLSEMAIESLVGENHQLEHVDKRIKEINVSTSGERQMHRQVCLIRACRELWRNPRLAEEGLAVASHDDMGLRLMEHVRVAKLLVAGRFSDAYSMLSNEIMIHEVDGLGAALLCDDLRLAILLSGGVPDAHERRLMADAERFFEHAHLDRVRSYHAALMEIPGILMGSSRDVSALEEAAGRADHAADRYIQAIFLAVLAIGDLRLRAWSRAHVRAERAAHMARQMGDRYLSSSAELIDALAREMLGEHGSLGRWSADKDRPRNLLLLGMFATREVGSLPDPEALDAAAAGMPCSNDCLWVLSMLVSDCQSLSQSVAEGMPADWMDQLHTVQLRQSVFWNSEELAVAQRPARKPRPEPSLDTGAQTELETQPEATTRVKVSVLGGFCIEVDGKLLPDSMFERRRARDLVVLLAMVSGHKIRRYQAIDVLWPDSDYFRGPRKLYEATGEVRKQLKSCLDGINTIVADRQQGSIGFDVALISSDIDDFEREARMTLSEGGDDFWVLDHARRMERLYASGPDPHLMTLGGQVVERAEELKTLYVDAAVAAGEAALRLGKAKLAVRYASDAHRMRDLREDAVILLVQALKAAGRGFEVPQLYRQFSRRLIEEEGVPPSLALRRAVALASEDGPDAESAQRF